MLAWPSKDPDEVVDYQVNWTERLEDGESISTSDFQVASGDVDIDSDTFAGPRCTVWLSGGTEGTACVILNRIETSEGRIYDQSVRLRIRRH
jgi:hypothetical protein